ncbi:MAG: protein kinase [Myxococcota bacterium]
MSVELGPFKLDKPIARGGMATVWEGVHTTQHVPVAIKVMTGQNVVKREFVESFRNEVQAVAGLSHPGIVMVFDHGEISHEIERESKGLLRQGSPYLVMDLATGGTLESLPMPMPWPAIKNILLVLLDALAHAHARGVIHRDLKPANVLLSSPSDIRPGLKLTDFGIAHAESRHTVRSGSVEVSMGTPYYMAPEQIEGIWRDYGPWTDLYALGCMAWEFVTGDVPFDAEHLVGLAYKHLSEEPPPLQAPLGVPNGFEGWLRRMMAKSPVSRFRRAADAVWALVQLDDEELDNQASLVHWNPNVIPSVTAGAEVLLRDTQVVSFRETGAHFQTTQSLARSGGVLALRSPKARLESIRMGNVKLVESQELAPISLPPLPMTWRRMETDRSSMKLVGTGLSLYGLRTIRLVNRDHERDVIWDAMHQVRDTGQARLLVLHGAAGNGKSRLVEWMAQRAHEVGSAILLRAFHSPLPNPTDGLSRMMSRHLVSVGLDRFEVRERFEDLFKARGIEDSYIWNAMTELVHPAADGELKGTQRIRFGSPAQRYALITSYLEFISQERPVIVWLDDVQWGHDALSFAEYAINRQEESPCRVLFLLTVRDEALAEHPNVEQKLAEVASLPNAQTLHIPPLAKKATSELIHELLGLEGELAHELEVRAGGNPLFAVQLVGDWVERGVLEVGERGFVLKSGEQAHLPDDLYAVWSARIERTIEGQALEVEKALELAAVLGQEIEPSEWHEACRQADVTYPEGLLPILQGQRLAIPGDGGSWRFAHSILRETLERRAREAGRVSLYHLACAEMLRVVYPRNERHIAQRIGHHFIEAGELDRAVAPLLEAARECRERSEYQEAHDLLTTREEALTALAYPPSDRRWGQGWVLRSWICSNQADIVHAWSWAQKAEENARTYGWDQILPEALVGLGVAARDQGDLDHAQALLEEARDRHNAQEQRLGLAYCLQGLGVIARMRGDLDGASSLTQDALMM